jgi:dienelactone hydrolase
MSLPLPTGPFRVGSATRRLTDSTRPAHLMSAAPGRALFLKLWYPAQPAPGALPERLWDQLQDPQRTPMLVRKSLRLLQRRSATYPGAPSAAGPQPASPVIYNHGLVSFASENTSLMQELASRGRVVIAIEHQDQLAEFRALNGRQSRLEKERARHLTVKLRRASPAERGRLARELYETSTNTIRIVLERSRDTRFALDNLAAVLEAVPGNEVPLANPTSTHLVGYSLGGAIATRVAAIDDRIASVINLDGGLYGTPDAMTLRVPYLMLYSMGNDAINNGLLPPDAAQLARPDTTHLNFHDIAGMLPALRWTRALGPTDPVSALEWRNRVVGNFIEQSRSASSAAVPRTDQSVNSAK